MKKIMLINAILPEETRIAIIEKGVLEELYVERLANENIVGNIYSGRIVNIEPSIQAAFVDFGIGRNGFLHISDVDPSYFEGGGLVADVRTGEGSSSAKPKSGSREPRSDRREERDAGRPPRDRSPRPEPRSNRDDEEDREARPSREFREERGRRENREVREPREDREVRPPREGRETREDRVPRDTREPRHLQDDREDRDDHGDRGLSRNGDDEDVRGETEGGNSDREPRGGRRRRRRGRGRGRGDSPRPAEERVEEVSETQSADVDDLLERPSSRSLPDLEDYRIEEDEELHEEPVYLEPASPPPPAKEEPVFAEDDDDFGMGLFEEDRDDDEPPLEEPEALYRRTGPDDEEEEGFGSGLFGGQRDEDEDDDEDISPALIDDEVGPEARQTRYDDEDPFEEVAATEAELAGPAPESDDEETAADPLAGDEERPGRRRRRRGRRGRRRSGEGAEIESDRPRDDEERASDDEDAPRAQSWGDGSDDEGLDRDRRPRRDEPRRASRRDVDDRDDRDDRDDDREPARGYDDRERSPRSREDRDRHSSGGRSGRGRDDRRGGRRSPPQQRWVDPRRPRERPPIQEIFKRGQEVLVQVIKEGIGNKGPTLTTYVSIPGRSLVAMPGLDRVGVSRKIEDVTERRRLRDIMNDIDRPANVGFIVRTAGVDRSAEELERDLQYLSRLWEVVIRRIRQHPAPIGAYQESDVIIRTIRDIFNEEIDAVWIDERGAYERAREFMRMVMPDYVDRVKFYDESLPMFNKFHVEEEIIRIQQRTVPLEKGGSIVIEQTEALVAIDVNSGTFRAGEGNAEETAYQMNLAAAKEIARQLRLRDLGGVIVNDFIDMREERHRRSVENTLREAVARDRAKTKVLRMSAFGMIEMTRQRIRPSLKRHLYRECPMCTGTGHVKTIESMSIDCMRLLIYLGQGGRARSIHMIVDTPVAEYLNNEKRKTLAEIEDRFRVNLNISARAMTSPEDVEVHCFDAQEREIRIDVEHLMIRGTVEK